MKYFSFKEFTRSNTAERLNIHNNPTWEIKFRIIDLVENVLDPAREYIGIPIYITSGYRCPELNKIIGGVQNSQHQKGEAADIRCEIQYMNELYNYIRKNLQYDQLIYYKTKNFIHVSYTNLRNNRHESWITK